MRRRAVVMRLLELRLRRCEVVLVRLLPQVAALVHYQHRRVVGAVKL